LVKGHRLHASPATWERVNSRCFATGSDGLQYVVVVLGSLLGFFFIGFVVAVVYLVCTRKQKSGNVIH